MARSYSRKKGKSGSSKPFDKSAPEWVTYKPAEVEALVAKYAKEKLTPAQIGLKLRDMYGIPSIKAVTNKKVVEILQEKKLTKSLPQDLLDAISKFLAIQKHLEQNKQDKVARRGLTLAHSRINRLIAYYKGTSVLDQNWKFNSNNAGMYLE
ncbi:MAG: 30S ribosomal protein S15 [Candidatus Woesearchaeota archaeon]